MGVGADDEIAINRRDSIRDDKRASYGSMHTRGAILIVRQSQGSGVQNPSIHLQHARRSTVAFIEVATCGIIDTTQGD